MYDTTTTGYIGGTNGYGTTTANTNGTVYTYTTTTYTTRVRFTYEPTYGTNIAAAWISIGAERKRVEEGHRL